MRFGICIDILKAAECKKLGFDYIEGKLNSIAAMSDSDFENALQVVENSGISVEACSLLFLKTMKLLGEGAESDESLEAYLDKAFTRMNALGSTVAVFGSGKSRFVPEGWKWAEAFSALVSKTKLIGKIAARHGIDIAIEPLNRGETNLINSLTEGAALALEANEPNVGLLADLYHMAKEGEDMHRIPLVSPLMHTHIALLEGRKYPVEKREEVVSFFSYLKEAGYDGRMSIEGSSDDWIKDSELSLKTLRELDGGING